MNNFQDILKQRELPHGPLSCGQDVYKRKYEFHDIFLGMNGFHTEKIVLVSTGKILEGSGAKEVLVQIEILGPGTLKAVLNGGHYSRSKKSLNTSLLSLRLTLNIL